MGGSVWPVLVNLPSERYFPAMKLFDAHCHLQDTAIYPVIGAVLGRAAAKGVVKTVCCGTSPADWSQIFRLAAEYSQVIPLVGVHPWFVFRDWRQSVQLLETLLREHPEAGVGETGLDFRSHFGNRAEQEASFAAHLDLARELNRPVEVHCVQAWGRLVELLREHPAPRVVLHAFGGAAELIPELVKLNCWFSFGGAVLNPKAKRVRSAVAAVPVDRLLIETDSPDFAPEGCPPPNEPANLPHVAQAVAELRGTPVDMLAGIIFSNSRQFFDAI